MTEPRRRRHEISRDCRFSNNVLEYQPATNSLASIVARFAASVCGRAAIASREERARHLPGLDAWDHRFDECLLKQFTRDVRAANAVPVLFVIPDGRTLQSNFPLLPEEVAAAGAHLVDGRQLLVTDDYYPSDSHWRASGHAKAAEKVAALVEELRP